MAEKKFQVFISSTFRDLQNERLGVLKAILDLGHIPSGMELFSAADEEQLSYIKKIIDECDYYVLIIGGRYGSMSLDGVSYTEKEYDYAVEKSVPVLAFIHENIKNIPSGQVESDPAVAAKLESFRTKVASGRLIQFWKNPDDLQAKVVISLTKAFKAVPRIGWVRGDAVASEEILREINNYRNTIEELKAEVGIRNRDHFEIPDIAPLSDLYVFKVTILRSTAIHQSEMEVRLSWDYIFGAVGPRYFTPMPPGTIRDTLISRIKSENSDIATMSITDRIVDEIKIQFLALGLLDVVQNEKPDQASRERLILTETGRKILIQTQAIRRIPVNNPQ